MTDDAREGIHLVVIGAGLAGLAAAISTKIANPAHKVTVLEATKELQEFGVSSHTRPPFLRSVGTLFRRLISF